MIRLQEFHFLSQREAALNQSLEVSFIFLSLAYVLSVFLFREILDSIIGVTLNKKFPFKAKTAKNF